MAGLIDLSGKSFGRLTVLRRYGKDGKNTTWLCKCSCGGPKSSSVIVQTYNLRHGKTVSCGCVRLEKTTAIATRHGQRNTKAYKTWVGMKDRCYNPEAAAYHNYGGRGIAVEEPWKSSFEAFHADMGDPPTGAHSIERQDVNGDYAPGNCHWATTSEQANNRRTNRKLTLNGTTRTLTQWAVQIGITPCSLANRLDAGWPTERALTMPKHSRR